MKGVCRVLGLALILPAALVPLPPAAETPPVARSGIEQVLLVEHNAERARAGSGPLVWSDMLARDAAIWAKTLARTNRFEHAPEGKKAQGENLWMGTQGAYSPQEMVRLWIDEKSLYQPRRFPDVSTNGVWSDVGHYTQLIWHSTKEVGCALASNAESDFLVCRYAPPGNWMGEFAVPSRPSRADQGAAARGNRVNSE
ncbi:MAG: serine protease [Sphingomonadales bacterium]|nr:serine protease [Sphingomonadales bacterium]